MIIKCQECEEEISSEATTCPKCGKQLKETQTAGGIVAAVILGLIGFVIFCFFLGLTV